MSAEAAAVPVAIERRVPAEDAARADFYALLARLFNAAPDDVLLAQLGLAPHLPGDGDADLACAWRGLVEASAAIDAATAGAEYETLFAGMGRSPVSIYAGAYSGAMPVDHPRVRIQADLEAMGLERPAHVTEPEDHIAGLLEVMRVLVAGGAGRAPAPVAEQRRFFENHLAPSLGKFYAALAAAKEADYYAKVAAFGAAFLALETESFSLD